MRRLWLAATLLGCTNAPSSTATPPAAASVPAPASENQRLPDASDPARALAAALAAANEAHGATPCERAFDGYDQMRAAVEHTHPAPKLAPREVFLSTCAQLPPEVQRCLELRYSVAHTKECQEAQAHLDPALQTKLQSLIAK
jgi:hypothetical protein